MLIKQPTKINCLICCQRSCVAYFLAGFSQTVSSLEVAQEAAGELENMSWNWAPCVTSKEQKSRETTYHQEQQPVVSVPLCAAFAHLCSSNVLFRQSFTVITIVMQNVTYKSVSFHSSAVFFF